MKYVITLGSSFMQALCWDFDEVWKGDYKCPALLPNTADAKELEFKIYRIIKDMVDNQSRGRVIEQLTQRFRILTDSSAYWRYPAEVDTLLTLQSNGHFNPEKADICLLISDTDEGRIAATLFQTIASKIWPSVINWNQDSIQPIVGLDFTQRREISEDFNRVIEATKHILDDEGGYLVITGGYKFFSIAITECFTTLQCSQPVYLVYKHETGGLLVHEKEANGEENINILL